MKRPTKACALTMRMTQEVRDRLALNADRSGVSLSEMAARSMEAGMFWLAFQRTVLEDSDAKLTSDEIKAATNSALQSVGLAYD